MANLSDYKNKYNAIQEKGPTIQKWKKILIAPYERSIQKLIKSRIIRKSIFRIVGPFSRIASQMLKSDSLFEAFKLFECD